MIHVEYYRIGIIRYQNCNGDLQKNSNKVYKFMPITILEFDKMSGTQLMYHKLNISMKYNLQC